MLSIGIVVGGQKLDGKNFAERANTVVVNAHGALILLQERVALGQQLRVHNTKTGEERQCTVVDAKAEQGDGGLHEVGIAFAEPSAVFWHVAFPPEDWTPRSAEAKRAMRQPQAEANSK
jgi:hypothetical protein